MRIRGFRAAAHAATAALLLGSVPAAAEEYLFKGDCERARALRDGQPLNSMFYAKYSGSMHSAAPKGGCAEESIYYVRLVRTAEASAELRYTITGNRADFKWSTTAGSSCPQFLPTPLSPQDFVLSYQLTQSGEICTLSILADWQSPDKSFRMTGKAMLLRQGQFAVSWDNFDGWRHPMAFNWMQ